MNDLIERIAIYKCDPVLGGVLEEAADRIEQLEKQRDELLEAAKIILSDEPLDQGIRALAAAVRNAKQKPMIKALEKDLDAATDEATRGEI